MDTPTKSIELTLSQLEHIIDLLDRNTNQGSVLRDLRTTFATAADSMLFAQRVQPVIEGDWESLEEPSL